ncbi:MAG: FHA domain-containing protein [Rhodanobacteraceae bacterium]|nr:FHA domain-containing protein [Rhodanobacteraceae bacterium]
MPVKLSTHVPDQAVALHLLAGDRDIVLGRDPSCEVPLRHASVSRRHARLSLSEEGYWQLQDLSSKNGTRIDGQRVSFQPLSHGRWFALGDVYCEFEIIDQDTRQALESRAADRREASAAWTRRLHADTELQQVLADLLNGIVEVAECQRGFLLTLDREREMRVAACYGLNPADLAATTFQGSRSAIERVLAERRAIYLSDRRDRLWLADRPSVIAQGISALTCLPLVHRGEVLGLAYADTTDETHVFTELDAELLTAMVEHAASVLAATRMAAQLAQLSACLAVGPDGSRLLGSAPRWTRLGADAESPR